MWNGYVSDAVEEFVDITVQLYTDKSSWLTSQQNGFSILNKRYKKELFESVFEERLQHLFLPLRSIDLIIFTVLFCNIIRSPVQNTCPKLD